MAIAKTYTVGDNGGVRRLDDLTGPWVDVPVTNSLPLSGALFDVETDPNDGDKVFVVGDGFFQAGLYGIYVSTDGGASWYVPGGNYSLNQNVGGTYRWWEVFVLDSNNIFVVGDNGYLAVSTDGGLTFNLSTQVPPLQECAGCPPQLPPLFSVHFITPLIGVVGAREHVLITYDAGVTWTVLNGGNFIVGPSGNAQGMVGIHISADQQTIVACGRGRMFQSTDAGNTFNEVFDWVRNGRHLTWINDNELWGFGASDMIIKSVDGGASWTVLSPFLVGGPNHFGGHFYQNQNGFFSTNANVLSTNNGAASGTFSETSPYGINAIWTWFRAPICYVLTDCSGELAPLLLDWELLDPFVGQVVQIPALYGNTCWTVTLAPDCQGATVIDSDAQIISFADCLSCNPPQCYSVVECTGVIPPFNSNDPSLAGFAGEVVEICITTQGVTNCYCFTITAIGPCLDGVLLPSGWEIQNCVEDCNACLPPPPPPFELHPRRIKPGYYTPGCPPEYTEKISCKFAEQMYDEMVAKRYGITICCDHDPDTWIIKKQILDLKAIYDPDLCKCFLQQCCPPTCVEATIQVFNPVTCTAPNAVSASLLPVCTCYQITAPEGNPCRVRYVDCNGVNSSVTIPSGATVAVCSQIYPYSIQCTPIIVQGAECVNGACP